MKATPSYLLMPYFLLLLCFGLIIYFKKATPVETDTSNTTLPTYYRVDNSYRVIDSILTSANILTPNNVRVLGSELREKICYTPNFLDKWYIMYAEDDHIPLFERITGFSFRERVKDKPFVKTTVHKYSWARGNLESNSGKYLDFIAGKLIEKEENKSAYEPTQVLVTQAMMKKKQFTINGKTITIPTSVNETIAKKIVQVYRYVAVEISYCEKDNDTLKKIPLTVEVGHSVRIEEISDKK